LSSQDPPPPWEPPSSEPPRWEAPPPQPRPQQPEWLTGGSQTPWPGGALPQEPPTSGKAIAALILGITGLIVCPVICSILALVFGYQGRAEIEGSGGAVGGRGLATAGIVRGWVGIALGILLVGLIVLGLAVGDTTTSDFSSGPVI
jgi:hypothetical protein